VAELQNVLQEVNDKLEIATNALTVDRTRLVLAGMHAGRLKTSLYKKEEKRQKKGRERLLGDGLPRVLTDDSITDRLRKQRNEADVEKVVKAKKYAARKKVQKLTAKWKVEQAKINAGNKAALDTYNAEMDAWKAETAMATAEGRNPQLVRPTKPKRVPLPPKTWTKSWKEKHPEQIDEAENDFLEDMSVDGNDSSDSSDEEGG
jgi:hypothetical protein